MPRASHTIRIFGTNKNNDVLQDIWLDIERIDVFGTHEQRNGHWQSVLHRLYWMDDPNDPEYDQDGGGNKARSRGTLRICSPDEEDQEDPEEWVPVAINVSLQWKENGDYDRQQMQQGIRTSADNVTRVVEARRVWHRDTIIDKDVEAATANDPTLRAYVVASDQYDFADIEDTAREDKDQFLEVQYISRTKETVNIKTKTGMGNDQNEVFFLRNAFYLNISEPAQGPVNEEHGFNPPWALDLYQAIVNVQWAALKQVVIGMPNKQFGDRPETMTTKDGKIFNTDDFGVGSFSGASGLGQTVIGKGYHLVAFGKPRDGDACFIMVDGNWFRGTDNSIRRGVINPASGKLEWSIIGTFPSAVFSGKNVGAFSCCFAGEAFFIQYLTNDGNNVHMAVSFSGTVFSYGIQPFNGVDATAVCNPHGIGPNAPSPIGGSVAYDKENKKYVTTGSFTRTYHCNYIVHGFEDEVLETTATDNNFMSSVSRDGTSWTAKFDLSQGWGVDNTTNSTKDIGNSSAGASTVCFSEALGLFVASSAYKKKDQNQSNGAGGANTQTFPIFIPAAGVATSTDGVIWTNKPIGTPSSRVYGVGDQYSFGNTVTFVKTGAIDQATGSNGFFLLGVNGGTNAEAPPARSATEMWRSEDGVTWKRTRTSGPAFPAAMTQINKNINPDKVLYV